MASRKKARKRKAHRTRMFPQTWRRRFILIANLGLLLAGALWYVGQPPARREEVRILLTNYVERDKHIHLWEVARDLYTLYYSDSFTPCAFDPGNDPVFGGYPRMQRRDHSVRILRNDGFDAGYCDALHNPVWVAYRLFDVRGNTPVEPRPDIFETDRRTVARVEHGDYTGTGYDRGHLAPNFGIARCYGAVAQLQTFRMSNVVPQRHELNAGPWKDLEMREALNYTGRYRQIWVIAGPVFSERSRAFDSGVLIPDACYKILIDEHEGGIRVQAFIMKQAVDLGSELGVFLASVDEIETLTGIDFLTELDDDAEARIEAIVPEHIW